MVQIYRTKLEQLFFKFQFITTLLSRKISCFYTEMPRGVYYSLDLRQRKIDAYKAAMAQVKIGKRFNVTKGIVSRTIRKSYLYSKG